LSVLIEAEFAGSKMARIYVSVIPQTREIFTRATLC